MSLKRERIIPAHLGHFESKQQLETKKDTRDLKLDRKVFDFDTTLTQVARSLKKKSATQTRMYLQVRFDRKFLADLSQ